jgi:hypothetical protein
MVSRDDQQGQVWAGRTEFLQEMAPKADGLFTGKAPVEHIAADQEGIVWVFFAMADDLVQDHMLVIQEGMIVQDASKMPVRGVKDAHFIPFENF